MKVTKEDAKNLRQYLAEYVIITLSVAVGYLFYLYTDLNKFVRTTLYENGIHMQQIIEKNSLILENHK